VFAVIGAKGGVGATTIAVNLAEAFAHTAGSTLLMDLNGAAGDAAVFLGIEPRFTVVEALENTHRLDEAFFRGLVVHTQSGLDLLASSPIASKPADPQRVRTIIEFAVRYYRVVVLDVPRTDDPLLDALDVASTIFVVVNHEVPAIRSAYRLLVNLRKRYGSERIAVLANRSDRHAEISLTDIEKAVNARVKHVFPSDYRVAVSAANKGEPFAKSTQGRLPASFHAFVRVLAEQDRPAVAEAPVGLFGRLTPRRSR
jgi:pilus assembly protein CpaE